MGMACKPARKVVQYGCGFVLFHASKQIYENVLVLAHWGVFCLGVAMGQCSGGV